VRLSDFDYDLPEALIATRPASPRSAARLLVVRPEGFEDRRVADLPGLLRPGDRLVVNNTRVIPARLAGERVRATGQGPAVARVEVTLMEPAAAGGWRAMARPLRKLAEGEAIAFAGGLTARVAERGAADLRLVFDREGADFEAALQAAGTMPLPPYIAARRAPDAQDAADYQTVFARHAGAVAAPTASLHFDAPLVAALQARGIGFTEVTLHVGAGTFLPVTVEDISRHRMHGERGEVTAAAAAAIAQTRAAGGRVIAVGTTALRILETAAAGGTLAPFCGVTDIFITPGFPFRAVDGLMTNFHLPRSTLLMLVSALMGRQRMLAAYAHAVAQGYRFFSYGDASLLLPRG
jgi:S-adenosylmethionine:tRNA ribosyltransferase-isomerase